MKGLALPWSSLLEMTFPFLRDSLSLSTDGGMTKTTKGLNSAVRRCFNVCREGRRVRNVPQDIVGCNDDACVQVEIIQHHVGVLYRNDL